MKKNVLQIKHGSALNFFKFLAENQAAGEVWCEKCKAYHHPVSAGAIGKQCIIIFQIVRYFKGLLNYLRKWYITLYKHKFYITEEIEHDSNNSTTEPSDHPGGESAPANLTQKKGNKLPARKDSLPSEDTHSPLPASTTAATNVIDPLAPANSTSDSSVSGLNLGNILHFHCRGF